MVISGSTTSPQAPPALVFNCEYNGLGIIQELGRRGVRVLALDTYRSVGTFSRYAGYHKCPDPLVAEAQFIDFLVRLGPSQSGRPVLFPTNDHWALAIAKHKERLAAFYTPCVADYAVVELLTQKDRFSEWATAHDLPVPRTWSHDAIAAIPEDAYPLVAKPACRRFTSDDPAAGRQAGTFDEMRLVVLESEADLRGFLSRCGDMLPQFVFQEYVHGLSDAMYTVGVYANREHRVLGLFTGRKVRGYPPGYGDCTVGQVERVPEYLKDLARHICREIGYHGIAEFEFKRDTVTREFRLIEINPRSWSWVGITPACGVSLPWLAYRDLTGTDSMDYTESTAPDGAVKWVKVLEDASNCLFRNRLAGYPEWHMSPREWWRSLNAEQLVIAEFSADDPVPGLYSLGARTRKAAAYAVRKVVGR